MVARPGLYQSSWNAGELDRNTHGSTQLKSYYAGAATMKRVMPIPQGGFTLMPGSRLLAQLDISPSTVCRLIRFTISRTRAYMIVLLPGTAHIYRGRDGAFAFSATVSLPYTAEQIPLVSVTQRSDTMFFWHEDVAPRRLKRTAINSWSVDTPAWDAIPLVDYGSSYTSTPEIWQFYVTFPSTSFTFATRYIEFTIGGETTASIETVISDAGYRAATESAIKGAIEALPSIEAGVVVTLSEPEAGSFTITVAFEGSGNSGNTYLASARSVSSTEISIQASRTQRGIRGGEALFSETRGYPSCGIFYQGRLILGGFRSEPGAILASRSGEYFDLNIEAEATSGAILERMDVEASEKIVAFVRARHLVVMTSEAEWYLPTQAIQRGTPVRIERSSGIGMRREVTPVEQEGSVLFLNATGTVVHAARYSEVDQGYTPLPISLLSSHLVQDVRDVALQRRSGPTDSDRYWMRRADGLLVCGHLLRDQDVTGFTQWPTQGTVKALACDGANDTWIIADRSDGKLSIEILEDGLLFDNATTSAPASATISGLARFNGKQVYALADGWRLGPFTVSGGTVNVGFTVASATVGLWTPPEVRPMPAQREVGPRQVVKRPTRVHTAKLDLIDTEELALSANGGPLRDVALSQFGAPVDVPMPALTGPVRITGLSGFTPETQLIISQKRPGRLTVRDLTQEARL